ncbi:MAG: metallophosphoesterase [Verrucomicrobiae bacterium]|nr:metallophosphoesterase [Verrucomicrobiae bacterium]
MNHPTARQTSRRHWLRLSAGTLLALGAWPGCARWSDRGRGGNFSFVVINDTHFQSPQCPEWFERVRASIHAHPVRPEFCLMVGDLAEHGTAAELGGMCDALRSLRMPIHAVIGNHDYVSDTDRSVWDQLFAGSLNYEFVHRGWRFMGLDSSEGTKWDKTRIQSVTLGWLDDRLPKWDRAMPTVAFTHFPLGEGIRYRPLNADDLLARLLDFNLVAVFNGHFHGFTERHAGAATLTTNRCCAISRGNHDGTTEKGYFVCTAREGAIHREFVEVKPA